MTADRGSRQDNSYERRRSNDKALEEWFREVEKLQRSVRAELNLDDDASLPAAELTLEVIKLAYPWAVPGPDAVIPGTRVDLAKRWMEARLSGRGDTEADWKALAWESAPQPDEHLLPYTDRQSGKTRYRSTNKRQDAITESATRYFRRKRGEKAD